MATFNRTGDNAGAAKWPNTFRMPMDKATNPIKKTYGSMVRVSVMVSKNLSADLAKPGATACTSQGAAAMPASVISSSTRASNRMALLAI
jgi:hypothetical protein